MFTLSEGPESWTRRVETLERQVVTAPADFETLPLQGEEHDQGGDGDGARESGGGDAERKQLRYDSRRCLNQTLTSCTSTTKQGSSS